MLTLLVGITTRIHDLGVDAVGKFIALLLMVVMVFSFNASVAESSFLELAEDYLRGVVDFSDKNSASPSASGYDPSLCIISFDFTDGNQTIVAIDADECKVFYFFDDNELMSALFQMITRFDEIDAQLTDGKRLQYEMRFSETEIHHITAKTMNTYYV